MSNLPRPKALKAEGRGNEAEVAGRGQSDEGDEGGAKRDRVLRPLGARQAALEGGVERVFGAAAPAQRAFVAGEALEGREVAAAARPDRSSRSSRRPRRCRRRPRRKVPAGVGHRGRVRVERYPFARFPWAREDFADEARRRLHPVACSRPRDALATLKGASTTVT